MTTAIEEARKDGNSLGGVVTCLVRNMTAGLGEPVFDKLDAELAKGLIFGRKVLKLAAVCWNLDDRP